jgi:hypothetical protein
MIIKMKKFLKIASMILAGLFVICACSDSDKAVSVVTFSVDKNEVTFPAEGGKDRIMVSGQTSWSISTAATWLKVSTSSASSFRIRDFSNFPIDNFYSCLFSGSAALACKRSFTLYHIPEILQPTNRYIFMTF